VTLKYHVDDVDVVEDAQQDCCILRVQPLERLADHLIEAAIRPLFARNKL
jgi:hypothetical protein